MKNRLLSLVVICCFISLVVAPSVSAQIIYIGDPSSAATQKRFEELFSQNQDSASVPVALAKLHPENTINTADLAKAYPDYRIPFELLTLKLPELPGYTDTLIVLWYLHKIESKRAGAVNVMLIARNENQKLAYFIDRNNNRNLADDGSPLFFNQGEQQRQIDVRDRRIGSLSFMLQNLEAAQATPEQPEQLYKGAAPVVESPVLTREKSAFAIHFVSALTSGTGDATISYMELPRPNTDETDKRFTYTATYYASLNANVGVATSFHNLYVGVSGGFELFEVGEQNLIEEFKRKGKDYREVTPNTGYWPKMRTNINGFIEYDIFISNSLRLAPAISYTRYNYIQSQSFIYNGEREINQYFTDRYSYSFGGKLKYSVTEKSILFLEFSKRYNYFDASSYFAHLDPASFNMKFNQIYGGVGLQLKLATLNK